MEATLSILGLDVCRIAHVVLIDGLAESTQIGAGEEVGLKLGRMVVMK